MRPARHHPAIRRFRDREDGAALVEFAIALPLLLVIFAVMIEGSRLMLSYQSTIAGVREATRYMSRILPRDACATDLALTEYEPQLLSIVRDRMSGRSVLPSAATLTSVTSSCGPTDYLSETAPVVAVEATLEITHPLGALLSFFGASAGPVTATVADRSRVFGS